MASRQQLVLGVAALVALTFGTIVGTVVGPFVASAMLGADVVPTAFVPAVTAAASLFVSGPLCVFMLGLSFIWHRRVRTGLEAVGVRSPAVGIRAPARMVAFPMLLGLGLTAILFVASWNLPQPDSTDMLGSALGGIALLVPAVGPLVGLLIGWRRGLDGPLTAKRQAKELALADLDGEAVAAFPLVDRQPRSLIRADLLRQEGRLDEADSLVKSYLLEVGVSPVFALLTWSDIHRDAGRLDEAERCLAEGARLVPIDLRCLSALADLRRSRGDEADAADIQGLVDAVRYSALGWGRSGRQRVQA